MHEVTAPAKTGYLLVLDQCTACGGIWCDRWELFPLSAGAAQQLDPVDRERLWRPVASLDREMKCPRCKTPMFHFRDRMLPPDARIERCRNCDGMWLNRGELRRLKNGAAASVVRSSAISATDLGRLGQASHGLEPLPTVESLSEAFGAKDDTDDASAVRSMLLTGTAWLVARLLLRLLLHV